MFLHVKEATYVEEYRIRLIFNDGAEGEVDLFDRLQGEMFSPLLDLNEFKKFTVDPELETIVWSNGADLAPKYLYEKMSVLA